MALVTTPGAVDANAYASLAFVDAYHAERGNTAWAGDDALKEAAIVRATFALDGKYRELYVGTKATPTQALAWPRSEAYDSDGFALPDDELPINLQRATAEAALVELATPGGMTPILTRGIKRKREKADVLEEETEYDGTASGEQAFTVIEGYIGDLLQGATSRYSVRVLRA